MKQRLVVSLFVFMLLAPRFALSQEKHYFQT